MLKIGITGGIGSGKSLVCKIFQQLGIPVFDADSESKKIINSDNTIKNLLKLNFGNDIYLSDGTIDKSKFASIIFHDETSISKANSIIHPAVLRNFNKWTALQVSKYVIMEAAILFESGADKFVDKTIAVDAPENLRIQRVLSRDKANEIDVKSRIQKQINQDARNKLADFIIYNDDTTLIIPQVLTLHQLFSSLK